MTVSDENLNKAFDLCVKDFSHYDLISFLNEGNIAERQIAALKLDGVYSEAETEILLKNLVGVDGKIREAVSIKINELLHTNIEFFTSFADIFVKSVIDVNGNVCRQIIDGLCCLKADKNFAEEFSSLLIKQFDSFFDEYSQISFRDRKYTVNKVMFKFYWCLEALNEFLDYIPFEITKRILLRCGVMEDYTVREKAAKILSVGFDDWELSQLRQKLKDDENYYVRRY